MKESGIIVLYIHFSLSIPPTSLFLCYPLFPFFFLLFFTFTGLDNLLNMHNG